MSRVGLLLVLVALLTGCAAGAPPLIPVTPLGALRLEGDARAANPCSLLDPGLFAREVEPVPVRGDGIGSCRLRGRAPDGHLQALDAAFDSTAATTYAPVEPPEPAGTATVLRPAPVDDVCRRVVALADGTLAVFSGRGDAGGSWVADCDVAEQGARAGLRRLATGGITYSPGWNASGGLAGVDACAALGDPSGLLGLIDPPRYPGFAGWRCLVGLPEPGGTAAWIDFVVVDPQSPAPGGGRTTIGTTPAVVQPYAGQFSPGCQAYLDRGPVGPPDPAQRQTVRLTMESPGPADVTCDRLRTLAADVVTRLG
ncbi:hypothetical protein [Actinomycetospora atypica]|uniref:DUF3558 domain-containing protein n=1 Tax=Actinomycetospora atypica TaxID=1290095 RepID=A0ABV9YTU2_9PSEU